MALKCSRVGVMPYFFAHGVSVIGKGGGRGLVLVDAMVSVVEFATVDF